MKSPNAIFSARGSERLVCIWALQDDRWLDDLPVVLAREHFEDARFGALFEAIGDTRAKVGRATPDTLEQWVLNSGIFEPNALYMLHGEGRCGSREDFEGAARKIVTMAHGRLLQSKLDDAHKHILDNTGEDPAVLFTNIEAMLRVAAMSGSARAVRVGDLAGSYIDDLEAGNLRGLRTGYADVDKRHGSFMGGELIVPIGEPGSGKTTLATNLARNWSRRKHNGGEGLRGHVASFEMGRAQFSSRMLSAISYETPELAHYQFQYRDLRKEDRGGVTTETLRACEAVLKRDYPTLVVAVSPAQTLAELEASVRATKRELGGLDYIIVDYLQRMRPSNPKVDRHLQIAELAQGLKSMAQRHDVPVIALSTINRQHQQRSDKRPQRNDIRESGAVEYEADIILGVHRPGRELEQELRAMAVPGAEFDKQAFDRKKEEYNLIKDVLELIALKTRQGEEGTDYLRVNLAFDTLRDGTPPRTDHGGV